MSILSLNSIDTAVINVTMETFEPDANVTYDSTYTNYRDLSNYSYFSVNNLLVKSAIDGAVDTQYRINVEHPTVETTAQTGYKLPPSNPLVFPASSPWVVDPNILDPTVSATTDTVDTRLLYTNRPDNNLLLLSFEETTQKLQKPYSYYDSTFSGSSYIYLKDPNEDPLNPRKGSFSGSATSNGAFIASSLVPSISSSVFCSMNKQFRISSITNPFTITFISSGANPNPSPASGTFTAVQNKFYVFGPNNSVPNGTFTYNGNQLTVTSGTLTTEDCKYTQIPSIPSIQVYFCVDNNNSVSSGSLSNGFLKVTMASSAGSSITFSSSSRYLIGNIVSYGGVNYTIKSGGPSGTIRMTYFSSTSPNLPFDIVVVRGTNNRRPWIYRNIKQNQGIITTSQVGNFVEIMNTRIPISAATLDPTTGLDSSSQSVFTAITPFTQTSSNNAPYILVLPNADGNLAKSVLLGQFLRGSLRRQLTYRYYLEYKKQTETTWTRVIDSSDFTNDATTIRSETAGDNKAYNLKVIPCDSSYLIAPILMCSTDYTAKTFTLFEGTFTPVLQDTPPSGTPVFFNNQAFNNNESASVISSGQTAVLSLLNFTGIDLILLVPEQKVDEKTSTITSNDQTKSYDFHQQIGPVSDITIFYVGTDIPLPFTYKGVGYPASIPTVIPVTAFTSYSALPQYVRSIFTDSSWTGIFFIVPDYKNPNISYIANTTQLSQSTNPLSLSGSGGTAVANTYVDLSLLPMVITDVVPQKRFIQFMNSGGSNRYINLVNSTTTTVTLPPTSNYYTTTCITPGSVGYYVSSDTKYSQYSSDYGLFKKDTNASTKNVKYFNVSTEKVYESNFIVGATQPTGNPTYYFVKYLSTATVLPQSQTAPSGDLIQVYKSRGLKGALSNNYFLSSSATSVSASINVKTDDGSTGSSSDIKVQNLTSSAAVDPLTRPFDNNIDLYFYADSSTAVDNLISFSYVNDVVSVFSNVNNIDFGSVILDNNNQPNGEQKISFRILKGSKVLLRTAINYDDSYGFSRIVVGTSDNGTATAPGILGFSNDFSRYNLKKIRIRPSGISSSDFNEFEIVQVGARADVNNNQPTLGLSIYVKTSLKDFSIATLNFTQYPVPLTGTGTEVQEFS